MLDDAQGQAVTSGLRALVTEAMQIYSLSDQGIAKYRRQLARLLAVVSGMAIVATSIFTLRTSHGRDLLILVGVSIVFYPLLIAYVVRRGLRLYQAVWESIRIEIGDDHISRSQLELPGSAKAPTRTVTVRLNRNEIVVIEEAKSGLLVRTGNKARTLIVPAALDEADYQTIKQQLSMWAPVRPWLPRRRII